MIHNTSIGVLTLIVEHCSLQNTPNMSHTPVLLMQTITILLNRSSWVQHLYVRMNENYSPFFIHTVISFAITSGVYWVIGLLFMWADLTERPKWLMKYKVQPWKRVGPKEYIKICFIVLRNQLVVNVPLSLVMAKWVAPWRGHRTDLPLPGALETITTWWFCLLCTEVSGCSCLTTKQTR